MTDKNDDQPRMGMSTKDAMRRITKLIQERNAKEADAKTGPAKLKKEND